AEHLRPAYPENQADQREEAGNDEEKPGAALRVADPEEGKQKGVPDQGAEEAAEHGVEGGEVDAIRSPVKIEEPRLARCLGRLALVNCLADHSSDAVNENE